MPNKSSLADLILEADQALAASAANAGMLPSIEKYRAPLEEATKGLKVLSTLQQTLIADKQKVTQDLKAAVRRVRDLLIHLKTAVRSDIGPRSEKLVEFKIAPLRQRPRKTKPPAEPEAAKPAA